jgi:hypothetical protein
LWVLPQPYQRTGIAVCKPLRFLTYHTTRGLSPIQISELGIKREPINYYKYQKFNNLTQLFSEILLDEIPILAKP